MTAMAIDIAALTKRSGRRVMVTTPKACGEFTGTARFLTRMGGVSSLIGTEREPQFADRRFDGHMSIRARNVNGIVYAVVSDDRSGVEEFKQGYPVNGTDASGNHVRQGLESLPLDLRVLTKEYWDERYVK